MKPKIYIDGQEGTTGLRIHQLLETRYDLEILRIDESKRKEAAERNKLLNAADVAFLCLPDAASRDAVALLHPANTRTRAIDASTAFRTDPAWAYGLPELSPASREKIRTSRRIAVPGCHASAFLLGIVPLLAAGIVPRDAALTCFSLTGYSGGGKKMIAAYEAPDRPANLAAPRPYALKMLHKHLPEMQKIAGLAHPPMFVPVVADIYSGLAVTTYLPPSALARQVTPADVQAALAAHYAGSDLIRVMPFDPETAYDDGSIDITACNGSNRADIFVIGHGTGESAEPQLAVITRLDNLGKGAAGAAVQCMDLALAG